MPLQVGASGELPSTSYDLPCRPENLGAQLTLLLRRTIVLLRLGRVLPFLLLFIRQQFLLIRVFLLQLLRLRLMLLLNCLFFSRIRLLLREFRVILLLLLLDSLPVLFLLCAELVLLLLVLPIQLRIGGGLDNLPRRNRNLVRMDCRRRTRPVGLRRSRLLPGSFLPGLVCGCLLLHCLLLCGLLFGSFRGGLLGSLLLRGFLLGFFSDCL
jgi:hypothetical protein